MIFVLDNYDSFTYNLVQYLGELGADVVIRRNDQVTVPEVADMRPERIVVSPGPCTPREAGISINLIRHFAGKVPVLGVCLGLLCTTLLSAFTPLTALFSPSAALLGLLIASTIGVAFGVFPAIRAARLAPIEALRSA